VSGCMRPMRSISLHDQGRALQGVAAQAHRRRTRVRLHAGDGEVEPALPRPPVTTPITLPAFSSTGPCSDVRLEIGGQACRRPPAGVADGVQRVTQADPGRRPLRGACSTVKRPANTPEPVITGVKREPSSLVHTATSSGARVAMP